MKANTFLALLFTVILVACRSDEHQKGTVDTAKKETKNNAKTLPVPQTISIYRYGDFPKSKAQRLEMQLKRYFPHIVLKEQRLTLPAKHYNKKRNRYRGTGLFEELSKHRNGDAVIGLTDYVIFKPNEISPTYGIMGVSPVGTYKCVVSSRIPKTSKEQTDENFVKLTLHELGPLHLPHQLPIPSEQPEGEELVVDEVGFTILGDEILIKKSFDSRHHTAGRPKLVFLDERTSCDILSPTLLCDGREDQALAFGHLPEEHLIVFRIEIQQIIDSLVYHL